MANTSYFHFLPHFYFSTYFAVLCDYPIRHTVKAWLLRDRDHEDDRDRQNRYRAWLPNPPYLAGPRPKTGPRSCLNPSPGLQTCPASGHTLARLEFWPGKASSFWTRAFAEQKQNLLRLCPDLGPKLDPDLRFWPGRGLRARLGSRANTKWLSIKMCR